MVIQKSEKGSSIVTVDRDKYMKKNFLSGESNFLKTTIKDDDFLNFITSQQHIHKIYKKHSMSEETRRHLKPMELDLE